MIALLLKDFYTLRVQLYWTLGIVIIFTILSFFLGDGGILLVFAFLFTTIKSTTLFVYDEMSHWDRFANTMPVKRETIIFSKYAIITLLTVGVIVLIAPVVLVQNAFIAEHPTENMLSILCFLIAAGILINSITIPFFVKFGSQKGRLILIAIMFIPLFTFGYLSDYVNRLIASLPSEETVELITYFSPLFSCVIFVISYFITVKIYKGKEF